MKILRGRLPSCPPHFSQDLRNLISRLLSKNARSRPTISEILSSAFLRPWVEKHRAWYGRVEEVQRVDTNHVDCVCVVCRCVRMC